MPGVEIRADLSPDGAVRIAAFVRPTERVWVVGIEVGESGRFGRLLVGRGLDFPSGPRTQSRLRYRKVLDNRRTFKSVSTVLFSICAA